MIATAPEPSIRPQQTIVATPDSTPQTETLNPFRWIIMVAVLTGAFLELLDTTSVNVALRQMQGNLGATSDEIGWVSTGYILSNVIVLPLTAWLSSVFGRRNYLTFSILLFTFASFACGASTTLGALVFFRILQGAGGAALLSTAQATLRQIFPQNQQGLIQSLYIVVVVTGPTLGPAFGGWMTDNYSWPWIFFAKAPLGLIAAALVWRFLDQPNHLVRPNGLDWQGIGLLSIGLGSLQYVLEEGERNDWFNDQSIFFFTITAVLALTTFVAWELSTKNQYPVVNLRIFRNNDLAAGSLLLAVGGFGIYGGVFIFPLFAQGVLGFTPTDTGLLFLPGGVATIIGTLLCGRLLNGEKPITKPVYLVLIGMIVFAVSQWMLCQMTSQSGPADTQIGLIVRGAGLGFLLTPITIASLQSLKGVEIAQGAGLTNLARQLGGSFGIAMINTYVTSQAAFHRSSLVSNIYSGNELLQSRVRDLTAKFVTDGYGTSDAHLSAVNVIERSLQAQTLTLSYDDAFLLIAVVFALATPLAFLFFRKPQSSSGVAEIDATH
jgi:DHA2 family multidrug resistance protein